MQSEPESTTKAKKVISENAIAVTMNQISEHDMEIPVYFHDILPIFPC